VAGQAVHRCFHFGRVCWIQQVGNGVPRNGMSHAKLQWQHDGLVFREIVIGKFDASIEDSQQRFSFQLFRLPIWSVALQAKRIRRLGAQQMIVVSSVGLMTGGTTLTEGGLVVDRLLGLICDIAVTAQANIDCVCFGKPRLPARMRAVAISAVARRPWMLNFSSVDQFGFIVMARDTHRLGVGLR